MPAPEVAVNYYTGGDLYLFGKFSIIFLPRFVHSRQKNWNFTLPISFSSDEFQTSRVPNTRRPTIGMS